MTADSARRPWILGAALLLGALASIAGFMIAPIAEHREGFPCPSEDEAEIEPYGVEGCGRAFVLVFWESVVTIGSGAVGIVAGISRRNKHRRRLAEAWPHAFGAVVVIGAACFLLAISAVSGIPATLDDDHVTSGDVAAAAGVGGVIVPFVTLLAVERIMRKQWTPGVVPRPA